MALALFEMKWLGLISRVLTPKVFNFSKFVFRVFNFGTFQIILV